jgi:fumarate hydratase class II
VRKFLGFNIGEGEQLKPMMMSINHNLQTILSQQECILRPYKAVVEATIPGVEKLRDTLHAKAVEFNNVENRSRT